MTDRIYRILLHIDFNSFYTTIECLLNPSIRNLPVAVCGEQELRHGIVVAVNMLAKSYGVKVGNTIGEALRKCPKLKIVSINQAIYDEFPPLAKKIYVQYSDFVENYGPDGAWIDITDIAKNVYDALIIADEIRIKVKETLGIPCSVGISFNKTISKLAAEQNKPDACTIIPYERFKELVWHLPCDNLLGVGPTINKMLYVAGITDIGNIAKTPVEVFEEVLGKNGATLHKYANGTEKSPVKHKDYAEPPKTFGHIHTTLRDMTTLEDIRHEIYSLSERVVSDMRKQHCRCRTVQINIRENNLQWCDRQGKLAVPSCITQNIAEKAMEIFRKQYYFTKPLRSIGVRVNDLIHENMYIQNPFLVDTTWEEKMEKVSFTMDRIRDIYGYDSINLAYNLEDRELTKIPDNYNRASYRVGNAFFTDA